METKFNFNSQIATDQVIAIHRKAMENQKKVLIEKARQWLNEHMYCTPIFEHDEDENPVNYVCASCCDSVEDFIENFRKAMEE